MCTKKLLLLSLFLPVISAQAEDLAGPPDMFNIKTYENVDAQNNPIDFTPYGEVPLMDESMPLDASATEVEALMIDRPLLPEKNFAGKVSFVNRRTNTKDVLLLNSLSSEKVYHGLTVNMSQCLRDYEGAFGNDAAFLDIHDAENNLLFTGWIYKKRPSVHVFENPIYSMALVSCQ
tara:strand:- start:27125 stop:27652 length:528 start_codon:yes stop_codon:yes gene_type:complete